MTDSKQFRFSIEALNDVLTETKSIRKKLNPFLARFQQYEMSQIYQTLDYLHQCMTKPKSELKYKFNSLFVLKVLFDTSNYVLVNWIEVFFLPHILEIAKFYIGGQNNGKDYFLKQGYTVNDDPEVEKFGFNYTLLATELLQVAALVKPYKLFESEFTKTKSDFALAFEELKNLGFKPPEKLAIYAKPQTVKGQVNLYEHGLTQISQSIEQFLDVYGDFSNARLEKYLEKLHNTEQEKYNISIVQLYQSGDLYLSSSAVEICKAELNQPKSLLSFENALNVLHRIMLSGDYECTYVLNFEDGLIRALTDVVDCDKTERGLKRGEKFFSQFKNPKESMRVYTLLLDYLQKWALFSSGLLKEDQNFLKKVVTALSETAKIQLTQPSSLEGEKKKFQACLSRNKQRNKRLEEEIQKTQSVLKKVLTHINSSKPVQSNSEMKVNTEKKVIVTSTKLQSNSTPMPPSQKSSKNLPFIQKLDMVQQIYERFLDDTENYDKNKLELEKFLANFQDDLATIPDEVFDQVYERAANLQMDVEEVLKKAPVKKSVKKQEQSKPEIKKPVVSIESLPKIETKQVESETIIEPKAQPERKSLARMQPMKDSRKINNPIEDTPVKMFDRENSQRDYGLNEAEKLGYNGNKIEFHQDVPVEKAPVVSQKQVNIGYEEQNAVVFNASDKINVPSSKNIAPSNNQGLGYDQPQKQAEYIHPSTYGYKQEVQKVQSKAEIQRQTTVKQEESQKQIPSHKAIRKTQNLSQSRKSISNSKKNLDESSIKSNSKVEHFSPESSQFSQHENKEYENSNFKKKAFEAEELEIPLEEFEEKLYINKPKEFKSLTGQARESKQKTLSQIVTPQKQPEQFDLRSKEDAHEREPSEHNASRHNLGSSEKHDIQNLGFASQQLHLPVVISPKNMPQSHQDLEQQLQEEDLILDEDQIDPPNISPLEESFHDIGELEQKIKQKLSSGNNSALKELSFKNCFETDKYILQRQQDKKTKMYWLQNETTNLVKNILVKKEKSRVSKINVPEILDERNKKYQQQLKIVEEEKNKQIKQLENKIKNLEKESQFFKQQAAQHAQEIRTLKANSDFDKESVGQKGYLKDVENIAIHKLSSPQRFGYSNVKALHFDASSFKQTMYMDPKGKLINSKLYKPYFQQFTKEKEKKLMLKSKDLLYKDKDIEIGFMSKKDNDRLIVTLYITPERDIESLTWNVQHENSLTVQSEPNSFITYVRTKKQEKIFFTVQVNNPGFTLPIVDLAYTAAEQSHKVRVVLPCSFHKFFHIKQTDNDLNDFFKKSENIVRGEEVPYSKRLLKSLDNLKDYFQSMALLNKGVPNQQGEISYGGMALYKGFQFPVRVSVKPNQFLYVQAAVKASADQARTESTIVEYFISTITHLLMKEIQ